MKIEQAKQIASKSIEELSHALEAGHSEKLREYLGAMARFHRYSLHNIMLIATQRPDATHVAGFNTWKRLGRFVKKGAKGIMILAPVVLQKESEQKEDAASMGQSKRPRKGPLANQILVAAKRGQNLCTRVLNSSERCCESFLVAIVEVDVIDGTAR